MKSKELEQIFGRQKYFSKISPDVHIFNPFHHFVIPRLNVLGESNQILHHVFDQSYDVIGLFTRVRNFT